MRFKLNHIDIVDSNETGLLYPQKHLLGRKEEQVAQWQIPGVRAPFITSGLEHMALAHAGLAP